MIRSTILSSSVSGHGIRTPIAVTSTPAIVSVVAPTLCSVRPLSVLSRTLNVHVAPGDGACVGGDAHRQALIQSLHRYFLTALRGADTSTLTTLQALAMSGDDADRCFGGPTGVVQAALSTLNGNIFPVQTRVCSAYVSGSDAVVTATIPAANPITKEEDKSKPLPAIPTPTEVPTPSKPHASPQTKSVHRTVTPQNAPPSKYKLVLPFFKQGNQSKVIPRPVKSVAAPSEAAGANVSEKREVPSETATTTISTQTMTKHQPDRPSNPPRSTPHTSISSSPPSPRHATPQQVDVDTPSKTKAQDLAVKGATDGSPPLSYLAVLRLALWESMRHGTGGDAVEKSSAEPTPMAPFVGLQEKVLPSTDHPDTYSVVLAHFTPSGQFEILGEAEGPSPYIRVMYQCYRDVMERSVRVPRAVREKALAIVDAQNAEYDDDLPSSTTQERGGSRKSPTTSTKSSTPESNVPNIYKTSNAEHSLYKAFGCTNLSVRSKAVANNQWKAVADVRFDGRTVTVASSTGKTDKDARSALNTALTLAAQPKRFYISPPLPQSHHRCTLNLFRDCTQHKIIEKCILNDDTKEWTINLLENNILVGTSTSKSLVRSLFEAYGNVLQNSVNKAKLAEFEKAESTTHVYNSKDVRTPEALLEYVVQYELGLAVETLTEDIGDANEFAWRTRLCLISSDKSAATMTAQSGDDSTTSRQSLYCPSMEIASYTCSSKHAGIRSACVGALHHHFPLMAQKNRALLAAFKAP